MTAPVVATDTYAGSIGGLGGPYRHAALLVKSDTDELAHVSAQLVIGGAGNINVVTAAGETVLLTGLAAGTILNLRIKQLLSTSTSATAVVALW